MYEFLHIYVIVVDKLIVIGLISSLYIPTTFTCRKVVCRLGIAATMYYECNNYGIARDTVATLHCVCFCIVPQPRHVCNTSYQLLMYLLCMYSTSTGSFFLPIPCAKTTTEQYSSREDGRIA